MHNLFVVCFCATSATAFTSHGVPVRQDMRRFPRAGVTTLCDDTLIGRLNAKTKANAKASQLRGGATGATGGPRRAVLVTFYAMMGAGFTAQLIRTLGKHPIFPFRSSSAAWSFSWLITTIFDYYGETCRMR
jgi:hypothetical protein